MAAALATIAVAMGVRSASAQPPDYLPPPAQLLPNQFAPPSPVMSDPFGPGPIAAPSDIFCQSISIPFGASADRATLAFADDPCWQVDRYREAFFQRISLAGGWLGDDRTGGGLGQSFSRASAMFAVPLGSRDRIALVSPTLAIDFLDGPLVTDVPPRLYSAYADVVARLTITPQWELYGAIRPGSFSDWQSSQQSFRMAALAAIGWNVVPDRLAFMVGVADLARNDFDVIPIAGVMWVPSDDLRFDLMLPKPKIAYRVGYLPAFSEDWIYVTAAMGGGSWAVERTSGAIDEVTLRDYRVALGAERLLDGGSGWYAEVGMAFGRRLEYLSSPATIYFDDAVYLEIGIAF